jgi:hypothetical protein
MFEHLPARGIRLVQNSVVDTGMNIIMQQDDAVSAFTMLFIFHLCMQHLKHLT